VIGDEIIILFNMPFPKRICVFCASSKQVDQKYFDEAQNLARLLAQEDITAVYGGGAVGLMGALADAIIAAGGKITGILPRFMEEVEWGHKKITDMVLVEDMHERKKLLIKDVDAIVALPGGTGTLEELFEVVSLKRLGLFLKPVILINTGGYYDPLLEMFDRMVKEKFLRPEHLKMLTIIDNASQTIEAIKTSPAWDKDAIKTAGL
jgi:hypothetical protein